jgi:hypothetical protein
METKMAAKNGPVAGLPGLRKLWPLALATILIAIDSVAASAACLDVRKDDTLTLGGRLTFQVFGGAPFNGGVAKGDTPEPSYILRLDDPVCVVGDDFLKSDQGVDRVQISSNADHDKAALVFAQLRHLVGLHVTVTGRSAFGAHTGHHHAPLMLPASSVQGDADQAANDASALAAVQGFYLALAAGNGEAAAKYLVSEKRSSGPLSAAAMTRFYGALDEPLSLIEVIPAAEQAFHVRYAFTASSRRCEGEAIVTTTRLNDATLISSIRTPNGC